MNTNETPTLPDLLALLDGLLEQAAKMYKALGRDGLTEGWEDALDEIDNAAAAIKAVRGG